MTKPKKKTTAKTITLTRPELKFEVYPHDMPETMTYLDAEKAVAKLGDGWRIPTKEELHIMADNVDKIPGVCLEYRASSSGDYPHYYWSSTELRSNANRVYDVRLSDGNGDWDRKGNTRLSCRPVRLVPSVG